MAMGPFPRFSVPTDVVFGPGSLSQLAIEVSKLGARKVLLITDAGISKAGVLEPGLASLQGSDIPFVLDDSAPSDPDTQTISRFAAKIAEIGADCVVAVGGGSAMCTGKGAALVATNGGNIRDYAGADRYAKPPLPCIAIPTTAGSGSEVSKITVITDERTNRKLTVSGITNGPRVALLDPLVLRSLPRGQAVASGVDALTHAIESYLSRQSTPATDALALRAMEAIAANFRQAVLGDAMEAKAEMLLASSMANMACGNAGLGLSHAINGILTAYYKNNSCEPVAYGVLHEICLPIVLEFNLPACANKVPRMAVALGLDPAGRTHTQLADAIVTEVKRLLADLGAVRGLPWTDVRPENLVDSSIPLLGDSRTGPNPRSYTREDLHDLYTTILDGWDLPSYPSAF